MALRISRPAFVTGIRAPKASQGIADYDEIMVLRLAAIILLGLLSRLVHTGQPLLDKYLGDALYAAMVYAILRLRWPKSWTLPLGAMAIMTLIELFQLTLIPAHLLTSSHLPVRILARLLGTQFSFRDLTAYAVGIACFYLLDPPSPLLPRRPTPSAVKPQPR